MQTRQRQRMLDSLKRWAPTLSIVSLLICFGIIALEVVKGEPIEFDQWVMQSFRPAPDPSLRVGPPWLLAVARDVTALGSTVVLGTVLLVVTGYLFASGKRHTGWFVLVTVLGGAALNNLLKLGFARPRPDLVVPLIQVLTLSFPSGHSAISAVCYFTLGALIAQTHTSPMIRIYVLAIATLLTVLVGLSRIYLGIHYPSDVVAGWCFGIAWALICWTIMNHLQRRRQVELPEI